MSNKVELPLDICNMIADYLPKYVLHDWIDVNKLNWDMLSENANAIELLKENQDKINWSMLSSNPAAMQILKENPNKIYWPMLSTNPAIFKPVRDQAIVDVLYEL